MAQYTAQDGFQDPLDGLFDDTPELNVPDSYSSTPEMREKLKQNLIEDGYLVVLH